MNATSEREKRDKLTQLFLDTRRHSYELDDQQRSNLSPLEAEYLVKDALGLPLGDVHSYTFVNALSAVMKLAAHPRVKYTPDDLALVHEAGAAWRTRSASYGAYTPETRVFFDVCAHLNEVAGKIESRLQALETRVYSEDREKEKVIERIRRGHT